MTAVETLELKGPVPAAPPPKGKTDEKTGRNKSRKSRIRCPHCAWEPRKSDLWACHCGCQWHTFDTGGKCPDCNWRWSQTQCQRCSQWAAHLAWYENEGGGNPLN